MIPFDLLADIALTRINNPTAKIVLLALARYSNSKGECWPSRETIATDCCISVRSVVSAIYWLEVEGYIRITSRLGTSNIYVITCMEEDMTDDTRANSAHEGNITPVDFSKKRVSSNTTSRANSARPHEDPLFLSFWQAYPRKIGKGEARVAFARACRKEDANTIVQAAIAYAKHCEELGTESQFRPHPSTWLNQERWDDDLEGEKAASKKQSFGWGSALDDL